MDSQPWPLLLGILFLIVCNRIVFPRYFVSIAALIVSGLSLSILASISPPIADVARAIASYGTLLVVFLAFYNYLRRYGFPLKILLFSCASWIVFAFVEIFNPHLKSLLAAYRTSEGRGLTSLSPEPTYFAIFMIFLAWLILVGTNYRPKIISKLMVLGCVISVFVLAQSAMAILYIVSAFAIYSVYVILKLFLTFRGRIWQVSTIVLTFAISVGAIYAVADYGGESRASRLMNNIINHGIVEVIYVDASVARRLEDAILSIHAAINNKLMPGGLDTYETQKEFARPFWQEYLWSPSTGNKIMSWSGAIIYELGLFGFLAYILFLWGAFRKGSASLGEVAVFMVFAVGAIPVAFPLIPMLLALWFFQGREIRMARRNRIKTGTPTKIAPSSVS